MHSFPVLEAAGVIFAATDQTPMMASNTYDP